MEQTKVIEYLNKNKESLFGTDGCDEAIIKGMLELQDQYLSVLEQLSFYDPNRIYLISIFPGILGVDRFILKDIKNGLIKYFTFGGLGVWWIKDIKTAKERCRIYNRNKLLAAINDPTIAKEMIANEEKYNYYCCI